MVLPFSPLSAGWEGTVRSCRAGGGCQRSTDRVIAGTWHPASGNAPPACPALLRALGVLQPRASWDVTGTLELLEAAQRAAGVSGTWEALEDGLHA